MTPLNPNLTRWILASIYTHLNEELINTHQLDTHFTGVRHDLQFRTGHHCQVKVDGPHYKELSKGLFTAYVEINIFISVDIDATDDEGVLINDMYAMPTMMGKVANALSKPIPLAKLGVGPEDTGDAMCCMTIRSSKNAKDRIETNNYGQIDPHVPIHQGTCEAHYYSMCEFK